MISASRSMDVPAFLRNASSTASRTLPRTPSVATALPPPRALRRSAAPAWRLFVVAGGADASALASTETREHLGSLLRRVAHDLAAGVFEMKRYRHGVLALLLCGSFAACPKSPRR